MAKDNQLTTNKKGDKLQMNGVNVSKAEVVDMIINEEIAKAQKLLDAKTAENKELHAKRTEKIKAFDKKVETDLASELTRSLKAQARKIGISVEKFTVVLPETIIHHFSRQLDRELRGERNGLHDGYMEDMRALSWLPILASLHGGPRFDEARLSGLRQVGFSRVGIMLLDKTQAAKVRMNELGFTREDVFDYTAVVAVPFPQISVKSFKQLADEIKQLDEERKKLEQTCTDLHDWIRKTRNKREEVTAAVTRSVLNTSEEGKQFLGDLDNFKASFGVRFEDVKLG